PILEAVLTRGNSVHSARQPIAAGHIAFEKTGRPGKQQTRHVPWLITAGKASVMTASIHLSGYWSGAPRSKDPSVVEAFKTDYAAVQQELIHYVEKLLEQVKIHQVDALVLAGDFNQCGITHDHVHEIDGLKTHSAILADYGFVED